MSRALVAGYPRQEFIVVIVVIQTGGDEDVNEGLCYGESERGGRSLEMFLRWKKADLTWDWKERVESRMAPRFADLLWAGRSPNLPEQCLGSPNHRDHGCFTQ